MEKVIQFTKNHWKKLSIASIPVVYGAYYIKTEYQISRHMRYLCNKVNQYPISKGSNVLVVLNPVANKKQCEKMFKKYCEPILHMAGYSVEVIKTKNVGHAKSLLESLNKLPDILVIAGGDGTSSEVVTGLLRRNEGMCPILFLPLGEKNETVSSFKQIESKGKTDFVKYLSTLLLALVQDRVQQRAVIKYELIESNEQHENRKPIFGLNSFSWGILRDIEINKDKYWYFGGLSHHAAIAITSLTNKINENISAKLVCTPPCPGCYKCITAPKNKSRLNFPKLFITPQLPIQSTQINVNKMCSTEKYYNINAKQINISCTKNSDSFFELNTDVIETISSRSNFLISMITQMEIDPSISLQSRTIQLIPVQSDLQTYYIDGEGYDVRPIKISFLPNAVKCFY